MSNIKHKFTKCECCPYYACIKDEKTKIKKWKCSRFNDKRKCVYDYDENFDYEARKEMLKLWLNANKEALNEEKD